MARAVRISESAILFGDEEIPFCVSCFVKLF